MEIKLIQLSLNNIKGVKSYTIKPNGRSTVVSGDNGTGKTTLFDAYLWVLFDMDSSGRKGAEAVKTTDGSDYVHYLDHTVEVIFDQNGKERKYKKTLKEKWTKPRRQQKKRYDGNVTSFWVDDVPVKANEYIDAVFDLVPDGLFQILSDPVYFSTRLHWKERLEVLTEMSGKVSPADIVAGNPLLEDLITDMGDRNLEDYKRIQQDAKRRIDQEINAIPLRIDEVTHNRPADQDWSDLEHRRDRLKDKITNYDKQLAESSEAVKAVRDIAARLEQAKAKRQQIIDELVRQGNQERMDLRNKLHELAMAKEMKRDELHSIQRRVINLQHELEAESVKLNVLYKEFDEAKAAFHDAVSRQFVGSDIEGNCPTCGQPLPEDDIADRIQQAKDAFNLHKETEISQYKQQIEDINATGKQVSSNINNLETEINELIGKRDALETEINELIPEIDDINKRLERAAYYQAADFETHEKVTVASFDVMQLETEFHQSKVIDNVDTLLKKSLAQKELDEVIQLLATKDRINDADKRIAELNDELKSKSVIQAEIEGKLYACDEYVVARTRAIEGKINAMFSAVEFKLFSEQINGGVVETCEAITGDTTYSKANTAAQINAGLDIIRAISDHYGYTVPVFVDRLESNLHLYPIKSQYIALLAKEGDIKMEVIE